MPIEDVHYLRKHSIKQNYLFMIDSKDRDRSKYPTPANYVVEFTQPFENVIGFEVQDATIPRTMYNVDVYNNSLKFFIYDRQSFDWTTFTENHWVTRLVDTGDYTIQSLVVAMNTVLSMPLNNDVSKATVSVLVESLSSPPDIKNKLKFYSPYSFVFDMRGSTMAETLGFDTYATTKESTLYDGFPLSSLLAPSNSQNQAIHTYISAHPDKMNLDVQQALGLSIDLLPSIVHIRSITTNRSLFKSIDKDLIGSSPSTYGHSTTIFEGPRSVIRSLDVRSSKFVAQHFTVESQQYLTEIQIALTTQDITSIDPSVQFAIYTGSVSEPLLATGNSPLAIGSIPISHVDGTFSQVVLSTPCFLNVGMNYWVVIKNDDDRNVSVYYNDVARFNNSSMVVSDDSGTSWASLNTADIEYNLSMNLTGNFEFHEIVSPGIYNLVGERYVTLRCPEIEENSFRSLAFSKHNLGLAKFRLGVVGYSETRMDFSKVPLREFHPIGRLSKITLLFETGNGQVYDFKGVNHTITVAIHYLEPSQMEQFQKSILNPNYNGNFIDYRFKEDDQEGDSDDQEEDFSRDPIGDYKKYEQMYMPENIRQRNIENVYNHPGFQRAFNEADEPDEEADDDDAYEDEWVQERA